MQVSQFKPFCESIPFKIMLIAGVYCWRIDSILIPQLLFILIGLEGGVDIDNIFLNNCYSDLSLELGRDNKGFQHDSTSYS